MELKITEQKVLEAASKCDTAKNVLKVLFPEVFKEKTNKNIMRKIKESDAFDRSVVASFEDGKWALSFFSGERDEKICLSNLAEWEVQKIGAYQYVIPKRDNNG